MKLKNKKTGEIAKGIVTIDEIYVNNQDGLLETYNSLAELCEEWEDYEEPKEPVGFWIIDILGLVEYQRTSILKPVQIEYLKEIGNYFETKEEAEKAVEKLKALTRLKDKGFKICGWNMAMRELDVEVPEKFFDKQGPITMGISDETKKDLDLLFGDEK